MLNVPTSEVVPVKLTDADDALTDLHSALFVAVAVILCPILADADKLHAPFKTVVDPTDVPLT